MPIILPQLPESLFSSYDPKYVPGYTAYTPKLRSEQGKIYGNATLKSANYEPGLQSCAGNCIPSFKLELGEKVSNFSKEDAESWNNHHGYFHPSSGKYFYTQRNHTYDGNPRTSSAIKVIEEIKYDLSTPAKFTLPEKDRWASIREGSLRERSKHNGRNEQTGEVPGHPSYRNENLKNIFKEDLIGSNPSTKLSHTNEYLQRRQGKLIYRANSGLLPNYSGYTPGQMFSIGSTWGKSSVNAIGKLHEQRFQWTSLF
ncbi:protein FAM166B-like isoform X1 [Bufo gargarizans]|uniref:protein FAM166B-like isoform X1 n=1 Tax=Bufo gargarizans TaxID=30331 RepID=UPI001CF1C3D9|nr:protein FAM166B-like isoform X1 [Bufo gargarizans]